jgi:hypothetical protein
MEVKPAASITAAKAVKFVKETTHWFGVPNMIITDNGTTFTMREFRTSVMKRVSMSTMKLKYQMA